MSFIKKAAATVSASVATLGFYAGQAFAGGTGITVGKEVFNDTSNNPIHDKGVQIIKMVGGVGGIAFTLAIMVIALFIIFGSISPQKRGTFWVALISCIAGAFVFFGAFGFAEGIMSLATT
ncbi:hypothetical protein [Aneurinibacillus tyrosinisolvens]|uniref:hypothetical protein n=1 Tax=Aneurinibacillus tyrosinisolvens TaxID=1443435 RepID=UPI00063F2A23|nr:hypothetical protein [Aneurinibacillus tyrosinisolvens]